MHVSVSSIGLRPITKRDHPKARYSSFEARRPRIAAKDGLVVCVQAADVMKIEGSGSYGFVVDRWTNLSRYKVTCDNIVDRLVSAHREVQIAWSKA